MKRKSQTDQKKKKNPQKKNLEKSKEDKMITLLGRLMREDKETLLWGKRVFGKGKRDGVRS